MENNRKNEHYYLVIDLKSFYASVECAERGLDPMTTNLVVADPTRTEKTICLAVSPSMKALGVKNRCRVFEIPKNIEYIMAPPRLQKYIDYSAEIYGIYLNYFSKEDIHVYSIDECFIDIGPYLKTYRKTPKEMALFLMSEITDKIGIRSTCGIGPNMYLAKIALDITAKHSSDFIGELTEESYREELWDHKPLTDFWRIGRGTAKRLEKYGIYTMRGIAEADEDLLHRLFGIDAELLIDHAWGEEPTTIADIKNYKSKTNSISRGQVLSKDYEIGEARIVAKEMVDTICLEMVERNLVTDSVTVTVGFSNKYEIEPAHGTAQLDFRTNSSSEISKRTLETFDRIVDDTLQIRRMYFSFNNVVEASPIKQLNFFETEKDESLKKEHEVQKTINEIKQKFGKNAMFRALDLEEGATQLERNMQIGGHKSGEE